MSPSLATGHDSPWDAHYPPRLRRLAAIHFTPLAVARHAARWLAAGTAADGAREVVDLGAGAGKFCLAAAALHPAVRWTGLERRASLLAEAERWRQGLGLANCVFAQADAAAADLTPYAGAYAYNPFFEHVDPADGLDADVPRGRQYYRAACAALRQNLDATPAGFRLVTYFCHGPEIPPRFRTSWEAEEGKLVGWEGG